MGAYIHNHEDHWTRTFVVVELLAIHDRTKIEDNILVYEHEERITQDAKYNYTKLICFGLYICQRGDKWIC